MKSKKVRNLLFLILISTTYSQIAGIKGVADISPDPMGFVDYSAALSDDLSLLVTGHSNYSLMFFLNQGPGFLFLQQFAHISYTDAI